MLIYVYALHTFQHFKSIPINCAIKCDDVNCSSPEHRQMIDLFYSQICCTLEQSSPKTIPSSNLRDGLDYIVKPVVLMVLPQNILFMLSVSLMYFYLCYSILLFGMVIYQQIL